MAFLSSSRSNGRFAFPRLEILWIYGIQETNEEDLPLVMSEEATDRIIELILRIVRNRANTPGVSPVKRLNVRDLVASKEALREWQERIGPYVDSLEIRKY